MTLWGNGTKTKPAVPAGGKYGDGRGGTRRHAGTDFNGYGELRAILGGVVTHVGAFNAAAGHAVVIDTTLPDGRKVTVCRFHVAPGSITVRKGDRVAEGAVIGRMGRSGNATGLCDHLEIRFWAGGSYTTVDPETWIAAAIAAEAAPAPAAPAAAPAFPLPWGWYFGPQSGPRESVSGYHGNREHLARWQSRMAMRGWSIAADGLYGDQTRDVARAFQAEKGLTVDGKIGPDTWAAAWTAPIT